jgi:hypothetical protein
VTWVVPVGEGKPAALLTTGRLVYLIARMAPSRLVVAEVLELDLFDHVLFEISLVDLGHSQALFLEVGHQAVFALLDRLGGALGGFLHDLGEDRLVFVDRLDHSVFEITVLR